MRRRIDLHHRIDVILRHHGVADGARDIGDAAEDRQNARAAGGDRQRLQGAQRIDLILRRLHHDRVGDAIVGIEPIGRRDLAAAGQIDDQTIGDVAFGEADILRAGAVDIDVQGRIGVGLLNARVGDARHMADAAQQQVGVVEIGGEIGAAHLQVDRRGRAEIQDLADDVGRQERKNDAGKPLRQFFAQSAHVVRGRMMVLGQLDLNIAVLRSDHAGVVVGHVDAADRHADIVDQRAEFLLRNDRADRLFDFGELPGAFLDARADAQPHMHQDLAGVDRGEEVSAEIRRQQERRADKGEKADDEYRRGGSSPVPEGRDNPASPGRSRPRRRAAAEREDCASAAAPRLRHASHAAAEDISPSSARACATG